MTRASEPSPAFAADLREFLQSAEAQEVLGLMNFQTCPLADVFRAVGVAIPRKVESEQAHVLAWLLGLAAEHGAAWHDASAKQIEDLVALARTARG